MSNAQAQVAGFDISELNFMPSDIRGTEHSTCGALQYPAMPKRRDLQLLAIWSDQSGVSTLLAQCYDSLPERPLLPKNTTPYYAIAAMSLFKARGKPKRIARDDPEQAQADEDGKFPTLQQPRSDSRSDTPFSTDYHR